LQLPKHAVKCEHPLSKPIELGEEPVKRSTIAVLLAAYLVCLISQRALAQKNEVSGLIGRTFISNQGIIGSTSFDPNVHFGNGTTIEINYARRFLGTNLYSLAVEVPFIWNPDEDLHAATPTLVPEGYASYVVTPSARVNLFPEVGLSPWVSFGGGFSHIGTSSRTSDGLLNPNSTGTNSGVLQVGAGFDVKLIKAFRLRLAVRDYWSGVPQLNVDTGKNRQHNFLVAGGVVYRF
jgi:hypothetical protein